MQESTCRWSFRKKLGINKCLQIFKKIQFPQTQTVKLEFKNKTTKLEPENQLIVL